MAKPEKCTRLLPGCRICCKQETLGIATADQLERQEWDFFEEKDDGKEYSIIYEGSFSLVFLQTLHLPPAKPVLCAMKRLEYAILPENAVYGKVNLTEFKKLREANILKELQEREVSFTCNKLPPITYLIY